MRVEKPEFFKNGCSCEECPFTDGDGSLLMETSESCRNTYHCPTDMESYLAACKLAEEAGL